MAERVKYNTTGTEEEKIPELEELAAAPAPAAGAAPAPSYNPSTGEKQSALFEQIASRGPFQYDPANDPLYKATADRYVQSGRMAMKDTMGQAAALTGGYGSSYGQAVGQQAYDRNLQGLADMIPELYQTAYKKYQDEGDRLQQQYNLLGQQEEREYNRYRDELGDWQYERAWQQQQQDAERQRTDEAYNRLYMLIGATGYMPTEDELAASGMSKEQAEALRREYLRQTGQLEPEPGSGGGGGTQYIYVTDPNTADKDQTKNKVNVQNVNARRDTALLRSLGASTPDLMKFMSLNGIKKTESQETKKKQTVKRTEQ